MFTGIVETIGTVQNLEKKGSSLRLGIASNFSPKLLSLGTSILVNGVCLTVEETDEAPGVFYVTLIEETLNRSTFKSICEGDRLNLETSLTLQKPIAGHWVLGHSDFTARIVKEAPHLELEIPSEYLRFFPKKGSITVHGVSLTLSDRGENSVSVELIPETLKKTILGDLKVGDLVNIEIDALARYLDSLISS